MLLSTPVAEIPGIGTVTARNLKNLEINNVQDLLLYFPFRYDDFSASKRIADLQPGETANIRARIELIHNKKSPRRRMYITECLVNDGSDSLRVIWFNQPFLTRNLKAGDEISLAGRVTEDYGGLIMTSPQYEKTSGRAIHTQGIVPVYHLTGSLTQKSLRSAIAKVINYSSSIEDWLPYETIKRYGYLSLADAVRQIHFPENPELLSLSKQRLGFNELLLMQLRAQRQRQSFAKLKAPVIGFDETATKKFVERLPFELTADQKKAAWEIINDLKKEAPMLRLLQGDVGSGKTAVACLALLNTVRAGFQAALMAPTEILAAQHYETLKAFFKAEGIELLLLTGSQTDKKKLLKKIASGEAQIIIGTHALIQKNVIFKNLALAVVDEQHRFGVEQRKLLAQKVEAGTAPHLLSMTATPIPRSLALAIYGDLDISLIKEMPLGRKKILTKLVSEDKREEMYQFVVNEFDAGNQAFIVCPLINESDTLGFKSVKAEFERLDKSVFKDYKIGLLHGKLKNTERDAVMKDFMENKLKAVVTTSIIEIGVDVPNASVMIIEDAERFGLAQLHQYRGRVGRRQQQAFCFLMSAKGSAAPNHRLEAMVNHDSGFELADIDLKFRGPGEVYGLAQKGFPELRMANFYDTGMIKKAREAAKDLLDIDPKLAIYPQLLKELGDWEERAHLE
jgi:ATP-dependent DNA helicase RecG